MTLKDHKEIGQVVLSHVEDIRSYCLIYADMAVNDAFADIRESSIIRFKAYMLMLGALEDLCSEFDFDLTYEGDYEDE